MILCNNCGANTSVDCACYACGYLEGNEWGLYPIALREGYVRYVTDCLADSEFDVKQLGDFLSFCKMEMDKPSWSGEYHIDGLNVFHTNWPESLD